MAASRRHDMASARFRLGKSSVGVSGPWTWGSYDAAIDCTASQYVKIELESTAGVSSIAVTIPTADDVTLAGALPTVTTDQATKTATFQLPATASTHIVKVLINGGVDANGTVQSAYSSQLAVHILNSASLRLMAVGEIDEASRSYGYTPKLNAALNAPGTPGPPGTFDSATTLTATITGAGTWCACAPTVTAASGKTTHYEARATIRNTAGGNGASIVRVFAVSDNAGTFHFVGGGATPISGSDVYTEGDAAGYDLRINLVAGTGVLTFDVEGAAAGSAKVIVGALAL